MEVLAPEVVRLQVRRTASPRFYAWMAVVFGSRLPEVVWCHFAARPGVWLPLLQTALLLSLAVYVSAAPETRKLMGFIISVAIINFTWVVLAPSLENSAMLDSIFDRFGWAGSFFLSRAARTLGAFIMIIGFVANGATRRKLLLQIGNWNRRVDTGYVRCWRRPIRWRRFAAVFLGVAAITLPCYLMVTVNPHPGGIHRLVAVLPWALLTSALNAANEEFQFRTALLGNLAGNVRGGEAAVLSASVFGINHYFGQPAGCGGMVLAWFAGWIWASSMLQTRGFSFAFVTHFVQDFVVFSFLALASGR